jgi:hypothetical protein
MSCNHQQQCAAPISTHDPLNTTSIQRCTNDVLYNHHCAIHHGPAKKLYLKYKTVCEYAYKLDIAKISKNNQVKYLTECYEWFVKAYNARMAHRKYAYVPSLWDSGHDHQFEIIMEKIHSCETMLETLYVESSPISHTPISPLSHSESDNSVEDEITRDTMRVMRSKRRQFKKQRNHDEKADMLAVDAYISENNIHMQNKMKLASICERATTSLFSAKDISDLSGSLAICQILMFELIRLMNTYRYFTPNYKPEVCMECRDCGHYMPIYPKIKCACHLKYTQFVDFLIKLPDNILRGFCELVIKNTAKIRPIVSDLVKLYRIYEGTLFLKVPAILAYRSVQKRLVFELE